MICQESDPLGERCVRQPVGDPSATGAYASLKRQATKNKNNELRPLCFGQIFDPALHPIQKGVYWTGAGLIVIGGGTWIYYETQANE